MNRVIRLVGWSVVFAGAAFAGCSSSDPSPTERAGSSQGSRGADSAGATQATGEAREVPESQLPEVGDASRTSVPGLEAAGPADWKRLPRRDEQYAIGWYGGSSPNILPRIFVRVEDWTGEATDTTPENLSELAGEIARRLVDNQNQVLEPPQAMLLGGEPWVRHVEAARLGNARAEKQILQRVKGGKLYTVELQIYVGKILESRDQAYAAAARLTLPTSEITQEEGTPPESAPEEFSPPADASDAAPGADGTSSP